MTLSDAIASLEGKFNILQKNEFRGETTLTIERADILPACQHARSLGFDTLVDVSSVDNFGEEPRFEMVYELYSLDDNHHLRLKASVSEDELEVASVVPVWSTANWHEREVYDMMGIKFTNHPDLRRILMWEGYPYFPLRKDFPLAGRPSEMPDVAFTKIAPLEGGPFVTVPASTPSKDREPRARRVE